MFCDSMTQREYVNIDSHDQLLEIKEQIPSSEQFLVASVNGQARFLLNNGTMAFVVDESPVNLYNFLFNNSALEVGLGNNTMVFHIGYGHSYISFNCSSCNNGLEHRSYYDFNGFVQNILPVGYNTPISNKDRIEFYLNNAQANRAFHTITNIYESSKDSSYKFIKLIHNCVAFLTDVYRGSDFKGDFVEYFTDFEVLQRFNEYNDGQTYSQAFVHKFYYVGNVIDPARKDISQFVKSIWGDGYWQIWNHDSNNLPSYQGIADRVVPDQQMQDNPAIVLRLDEIKHIRHDTYPGLISLSASFENQKVPETQLKNLVDFWINKDIVYKDLYYSYVLKHQLAIEQIFVDKPYAKQMIYEFDSYLGDYCKENQQEQICLHLITGNCIGQANMCYDNHF